MKGNRQVAIINLIENSVIDTQERLQAELQKMGYSVTQATVSRDIKALNIVKGLDNEGNYRYTVNRSQTNDNKGRYTDIFKNSAVSIKSAMNDVIVKCYAGTASAACAAIDSLFSDMFVGTLAGDDTILIITADTDSALILVEKLNEILGK